MKRISRTLLIGTLLVILITSACSAFSRTPPATIGTLLPTPTLLSAISPTVAVTATGLMPVIPITGENVVEMQCQFCVNSLTHVVFIFPDVAIFDVETSTPVTCLTAEVVNGKRVLVCNGTPQTTFNLKICSDTSNCLLFPVTLQPCPLAGTPGAPLLTTATPMAPIFLTAINTLSPPSSTPVRAPSLPSLTPTITQTGVAPPPATATSTPGLPPATATTEPPPPPSTATLEPAPTPTSPPPATEPATNEPTVDNKKPSKTPKP